MTKSRQKGLLKRFSAKGIEVDEAAARGRLVVADATEALGTFMEPGGPNHQKFLREFGAIIRKAEAAADVKHRRVVVFVKWLRSCGNRTNVMPPFVWNNFGMSLPGPITFTFAVLIPRNGFKAK